MSWVEIIGAVMLMVLLIENAVLKRRTKELKEMLDGSVPKETVDKLLSEMQQEKNADN